MCINNGNGSIYLKLVYCKVTADVQGKQSRKVLVHCRRLYISAEACCWVLTNTLRVSQINFDSSTLANCKMSNKSKGARQKNLHS